MRMSERTIADIIKAQFDESILPVRMKSLNVPDMDCEPSFLVTTERTEHEIVCQEVFIVHIDKEHEIHVFKKIEAEREVQEGLRVQGCGVCNMKKLYFDLEELMDLGWYPEVFLGENQIMEPVCPDCINEFTVSDGDGAISIRPSNVIDGSMPDRNMGITDTIEKKFNRTFITMFWPHFFDND
jgi:hypothetical protein